MDYDSRGILLNGEIEVPCNNSDKRYYSDRGIQLTYIGQPIEIPLVVVELTKKWYKLFVIMPDGTVSIMKPDDEVRFLNNVYNPEELQKYCDKHNMYLDILSYELILGRWIELYNS